MPVPGAVLVPGVVLVPGAVPAGAGKAAGKAAGTAPVHGAGGGGVPRSAPPPGPLAWWRFEEGGDRTVRDSSGNGHDATISGKASRETTGPAAGGAAGGGAAGAVPSGAAGGKALMFDGHTRATAGGPVLRSDGAFTVTAWVRLDPEAADLWGTVVSLHDGTYDAFLLNYNPDGRQVAIMTPDRLTGDAVDSPTSNALRPGVWTHLAAVRDVAAGRLLLYVDGRLAATAARAQLRRAKGPLDIGQALAKGKPLDEWRGAIDDVRVFDRALSPPQIEGVRTDRR